MEGISVSLDKTKKLIIGLFASAILTLAFFAMLSSPLLAATPASLTPFQRQHLIDLYSQFARGHQADASKSPPGPVRNGHIRSQIGCLDAIKALRAGSPDPGTCQQ